MQTAQNLNLKTNYYSNNFINKSYKNPQNKIAFRGVSIDGVTEKIEEVAKSSGQKIIDETKAAIIGFIENDKGLNERLKALSGNLKEVAAQAERRRKKIKDTFWVWDESRKLAAIDDAEEAEHRAILEKKRRLIDKSMQNTLQAVNEACSLPGKLAEFDPVKTLQRQRANEALNVSKSKFGELKGFKRVAGYKKEQFILDNFFIKEIKKEKAGNPSQVPGSVLFFGPTGNGKTTFARAFAEETSCEIKPIITFGEKQEKEKTFIKKLYEKAEESKQRFEEDKTRTILFVDEIDRVIDKTSCILPQFEEFLKICSEKYHCTVFVATNEPLNIGLDMSKSTNFPYRVSIEPPDRHNTIEVFKHYLEDMTSGKVSCSILAEELRIKGEKEKGVFSNSQIEEICLKAAERNCTQEDLLGIIKDKNTVPAIEQKALDKFRREEQELMKNKIKVN